MHRITVKERDADRVARWKAVAAREGKTLQELLAAAADLAVARGGTR